MKKNDNTKQMVASGVARAAVGAAIGVAASAIVADPKNKKRISKVVNEVKKQTSEYVDEMVAPKIKEAQNVAKKLTKDASTMTSRRNIEKTVNPQLDKAKKTVTSATKQIASAKKSSKPRTNSGSKTKASSTSTRKKS